MVPFQWQTVVSLRRQARMSGRIGFEAGELVGSHLVLEFPDTPAIDICAAGDLFSALLELRLELGADDTFLSLNGSRLDVYPSGMQRDMSLGPAACVMQLPRRTTKYEVVNIFDAAPAASKIATVEEQREFRDIWIKSPLLVPEGGTVG